MLQGLATFPGIKQIVSATMDFTTGINPSVASLTIAPQQNFTALVGPLTFFDGRVSITFPNARLLTNTFERNSAGFIWRLAITDRRWMWQSHAGGGAVSFGANFHYEDNSLIKATEKTLQELAKICLEAMGERNFDVSALPSKERPEVLWDGALPAQALEELCDSFGYTVVLGLNNRVSICKVGYGSQLPLTNDVLTNSLALDIPSVPDKVAVVCAPTRFQIEMPLEAVGIENDRKNTLKLIDDLSYKPAVGWSNSDIYGFDNIPNLKERNFAIQSVFRYYRVQFPLLVPGYTDSRGGQGYIQYPWQIHIEDTQCEFVDEDWDLPEEQRRCKASEIGGIFYNELDGVNGNNVKVDDLAIYRYNPCLSYDEEEDAALHNYNWHLGGEAQIGKAKWHYVTFDKPVYRNTSNSIAIVYGPARLVLRAAVTVLDRYTNSPVRHTVSRDTGQRNGTPTRYEFFPDLYLWNYWDYDAKKLNNNLDLVNERANYYLDGLIQQYQMPRPQTVTYAGLKYVEPDGAVKHLHFAVGRSGCTTSISRNTEQIRYVQPMTYRKLMGSVRAGIRENRAARLTLQQYQLRAGVK